VRRKIYTILLALLPAFTAGEAFALDMSVGVQSWYCWWEPAWDNDLNNVSWEMDPGFLAGPMVSFKLSDRLSLSSVLMLGLYDAVSHSIAGETWTREIIKYDMDTTLSYSINSVFRVFGGLKIQGYVLMKNMIQGQAHIPETIILTEQDLEQGFQPLCR